MKNNKVVVIGNGHVGSSYSFLMASESNTSIDEIAIISRHENVVKSCVEDLRHMLPFNNSTLKVKSGDYSDCEDADIIVFAASASMESVSKRSDLLEANHKIFKSIIAKIMENHFKGIFIIASNPVDTLSYITKEISGFPKEKVIGSGTIIDSARFQFKLSEIYNVSPSNIQAMVLGEHGDSQVPIWSKANIAGVPLKEKTSNVLEEITTYTKEVGTEILKSKGNTSYGIAKALTTITNAIIKDENTILTVSSYLSGEYGYDNLYSGVPTLINKYGAQKIIELPLDEKENQNLKYSFEILKKAQDEISKFR